MSCITLLVASIAATIDPIGEDALRNYPARNTRIRNPWFVQAAPGRGNKIVGYMIHATRSTRSDGDDGPGTENWANNPNNRGKEDDGSLAFWGGAWDDLIFETGERVTFTDLESESPTFGAGFGNAASFNASIPYIQGEVAQGNVGDTFTFAEIDSLAQRVGECSLKFGFPIERVAFLDQRGTPTPGICTHEDSDNGKRLGKSDPGPRFPWKMFIRRARLYRAGEDPGEETAEEREERVGIEEDALKLTEAQTENLLLRLFAGSEFVNVGESRQARLARALSELDRADRAQSVSDTAASAIVVALRSAGAISDAMSEDEVKSIVEEELANSSLFNGGRR